ncbi:MAG: SPOR domain-containing protein, partial [Desulfobacteraceae bacterium]
KSKKGSKRKYKIELTSLSFFFWGFCLFFLLSWTFVLGILVGRGFLPGKIDVISELKDQMTKLQGMVTRKKPSNSESGKKEDVDPQLAFYERLSTKKDEVKKKVPPRVKPGASGAGGNREKLEATKSLPPNTNRKNKAQSVNQKSGAEANEAAFTVQLASLGHKDRAEDLIKKLMALGHHAYFYEAEVRGKIYYRVRSGRFNSREEAGNHARKLAKKAGVKGFVVRIE